MVEIPEYGKYWYSANKNIEPHLFNGSQVVKMEKHIPYMSLT